MVYELLHAIDNYIQLLIYGIAILAVEPTFIRYKVEKELLANLDFKPYYCNLNAINQSEIICLLSAMTINVSEKVNYILYLSFQKI